MADKGLRSVLAHFVSRQFGTFLLIGGLAACVNFLSGAAVRLVSTTAFAYGVSLVVGMAAGTIVSFYLNRHFTFRVSDEPVGPQAVRFGLVALGAVVLVALFGEAVLALWSLAGSPWLSRATVESLAHVAAIGLNTIYSFVAMKFFALKKAIRVPPAA